MPSKIHTTQTIERDIQDIEGKRRTARQLDQKPLRIDDARE